MIDKPLTQVKDIELVNVFKHIFTEADGRQKDLLTEAPSVSNIDEKTLKLYHTGAALRLYTKYEGTLYYLQFT
jgi:hypothetical protein